MDLDNKIEILQNGKLSPDRKWKSTGNVGQPRKPFWERLSNSKDPVPTRPMAASLGASMNRRKKKVFQILDTMI